MSREKFFTPSPLIFVLKGDRKRGTLRRTLVESHARNFKVPLTHARQKMHVKIG